VSALEPGLYRATVCGIPDTIVTVKPGAYATTYSVGRYNEDQHRDITDARPLIVLDLGSPEFAAEIAPQIVACLRREGWGKTADQIAEQTEPAKIEEPPQGKRVEANLLGFPSWNEYLHIGTLDDEHWVRLKDGNVYAWDLLTNPEVVTS